MNRAAALLLATALPLVGACSSSGSSSQHSTSARSPGSTMTPRTLSVPNTLPNGGFPPVADPTRNGSLKAVRVTVTTVAKVDFSPMALVARPGHPTQLFIAQRSGKVRLAMIDPTTRRVTVRPEALLDLSAVVGETGEEGLLGLAFDRSGSELYLSYNVRNGDSRIDAVRVTEIDGRPRLTDRHNLLKVDQGGTPIHKGGDLQLGPDGYLYIGLGDGGPEDDPDQHAQNPDLLLGKLLRIDPSRHANGKPYAIPADNPHATDGNAAPEIWATGLRNPWRFSFDPANGDLWIGDVGQSKWEEIDRLPAGPASAGANLGWSGFEGTHVFRKGRVNVPSVPPIFEINHSKGVCAITGGVVYRDKRIPALDGAYLYSDYCRSGVYAIRSTTPADAVGRVTDERLLAGSASASGVISFGTDDRGEVYLLSLDGTIRRIEPAR